jgi:hypothetical protein
MERVQLFQSFLFTQFATGNIDPAKQEEAERKGLLEGNEEDINESAIFKLLT